jgi:nitrogen fixation protein FixH
MADEIAVAGNPLTGRKVFAMFAGAFALIIGVNVFMAYSAVGTFPGLEVKNTYVASQTFDADRKAQEALGWDVSAALDGPDTVTLTILAPGGQSARVEAIDATIGRATQRTDDQVLSFEQNDRGVHVASVTPLDTGKWELRFVATAASGVQFRQRIALIIPAE